MEDQQGIEVRAEDTPPFTMCPHWVLLSELTPQAKALWWALAAHVNRAEGDRAWPSRQTLADILGMSRPQSVDRYLDELETFGAIRVEAQRLGRMKVTHRYFVRFNRPSGCSAPTTVEEFYRRRSVQRLGVFSLLET